MEKDPEVSLERCQSQDQFDDDFDDCEFAEKSEFIAGLTGEMRVYLLGMCIWCSSTRDHH